MGMLKLTPACKDYLWGGERLRRDFGVESELHPLAEAWVLSAHPDGLSRLPDGTALTTWLQSHPGSLGTNCERFPAFPILTKLIDAKDDLSIQVHPSDEYALRHEHQYGKTEMWYVLDAEPGAFLYYGFRRPVTKEEFLRRVEENSLTEVLNAVPVKKGDVFFIPSGTLHALGRGILIAEVQQSSNVTYRIYDYGRLSHGVPRPLHLEKALEVLTLAPPQPQDFGEHLAKCEYFTVDVTEGAYSGWCDESSFVSLLVVEGSGTVSTDTQALGVRKGDSLFLPAGTGTFRITGGCTVLRTRVG